MHWSQLIADELEARDRIHVIETGTSISGIPHVGNASDVIRGDAVRKILSERGFDASLIWVADDSDPFRKTPRGMENLADQLGKPVYDIPDPSGDCHANFVEHFAGPFLDDLREFGVEPVRYSGRELYLNGELVPEIRLAFKRRDSIREILNRFRDEPLAVDFIPWSPICGGCGRISTTTPKSIDGDTISYVCEGADVSGTAVSGCGHKGESDITKGEGKLPWRVEWAARWARFKVTCEPFGKEHATVGGSYDTSKIISKEVFGWEPPVPVVYEFFTLNGAKISSSAGNVITLSDWLKIAEPEVLKYFMYKRLEKQRDIDLSRIPNLTDEYDEAERVFFGEQEGDDKTKKHYLLSQVSGESGRCQVPYTLCAVLAQVVPDSDLPTIKAKVDGMGYAGYDDERLIRRVNLAGQWVSRHGPDYLTFDLTADTSASYASLTDLQKKTLAKIASELSKKWTPESFHKRIYEISREAGLKPPEAFKAIYLALIGKEKGPKAAAFILSLDKDFVAERFRAE
ncbi:MAG: lysine--tRNA ligase [Candidatus Altiarchaeota archaeon]